MNVTNILTILSLFAQPFDENRHAIKGGIQTKGWICCLREHEFSV